MRLVLNEEMRNKILEQFPEVLKEVEKDFGYFTAMAEVVQRKRD